MGRKFPGYPYQRRSMVHAGEYKIGLALHCVAAWMLCTCIPLRAQQSLHFEHYGAARGLSSQTVLDMVRDHRGLLWLATQDGLNRLDGYSFQTWRHKPGDANSLADNFIWDLALDANDTLWIATQSGGLSHFDPHTESFENFRHHPRRADSLAENTVRKLWIDTRGRLWLGTDGAGLDLYLPDENTFRHFRHRIDDAQSLPGDSVLSLLGDGVDGLWVGTDRGLCHFDPRQGCTLAPLPDAEGARKITALALQGKQALWIGASDYGLARLDLTSGTLVQMADLAGQDVSAIMIAKDGGIWVGTQGMGLFLLDETGHTLFHVRTRRGSPGGLTDDRVISFLEDYRGMIWVGTWAGGLDLHDPATQAFRGYKNTDSPTSLSQNSVYALSSADDKTLWAATFGGGLNAIDLATGSARHFRHDPGRHGSLPDDRLYAVLTNQDGTVWVGSAGGGLALWKPDSGTFFSYRHDPNIATSLGSDSVRTLTHDGHGGLWIGTTDAGLDFLAPHGRKFIHYPPQVGATGRLQDGFINAVFITSQGRIWVGTRFGGLHLFDPGQGSFQHFPADPKDVESISHDAINSFAEDRNGKLWVGTGGGLNQLIGWRADGTPRFRAYTTADGLAADSIGPMFFDRHGRLWLSTIQGVSRFDPLSKKFRNFGARQGVQASGYYIGSGYQAANGEIFFGGIEGITAFYPQRVPSRRLPPPALITQFLLVNQPVAAAAADSPLKLAPGFKQEISLDFRQNLFGFEFAAPDFGDPKAVRYQYRLDDWDRDWVATDASRRLASYNGLPPGKYRFRLRARVADGPWSAQEAQLDIRLLPPPWRSPWAYLGYFLLAAALTAAFARERYNRRLIRRRAAGRVAESEERLRLTLWSTGDELWDWDLNAGRVFRLNTIAGIVHPIGISADPFETVREVIHPEDYEPAKAIFDAHFDGQTPDYQISYRVRCENGEWMWVRDRGRIVERDSDGQPIRITGTRENITAQKQVQAELRATDRALRSLNRELEDRVAERTAALSESNQVLRNTLDKLTNTQRQLVEAEKMASLGNLVAGVAHEINTPLGIAVSAATHLQDEARKLSAHVSNDTLRRSDLARFDKLAGQAAEMVVKNLSRASRLVNSFKQVAADQSNSERRQFNLRAYLEEIITSLQPKLRSTPHRLILDCPNELEVDGYPAVFYQIVSNLVMNSLLHGLQDGTPGTMTVRVTAADARIEMCYTDDGVGMSKVVREKIFEPFFTTLRGSGGTGLGLHIVYNLVHKALGGSIECQSAPNQGVTFTLLFPRYSPE